jgi:thiol-disulfide isomerase/thioredoxin
MNGSATSARSETPGNRNDVRHSGCCPKVNTCKADVALVMMNPKALAIALILVGLGGWGLHHYSAGPSPAPTFQAYSARGKPFDLREQQGRVVVLDFFATWCPPCRAAIPSLQQISDAYKDRGVEVVGLQVSDTGDARELFKQLGASYTVLVNADQVARAYNVRGLPTLVIIGKDGAIAHQSSGWGGNSQAEIIAVINEQLAR